MRMARSIQLIKESRSRCCAATLTCLYPYSPSFQAQVIKKPKFMPLGFLALMQPAVMSSRERGEKSTSRRPPSFVVSNYYQDAEQIPQYAIDEVATASNVKERWRFCF
jgi:hypothetical protein